MTVLHKIFLQAGMALTLAAGVIAGTATAADLPVQPHMRSYTQSNDGTALSATRPSIKPIRKSGSQAAETTS